MTKMIEILEIVSEGYGEYYAASMKVVSVDEFIEYKKLYEEEVDGVKMYGDNGWYCDPLSDGWYSYGYDGEEYEGMFKVVVSEEEKNKFLNMNNEELDIFVDSMA